MRGAERSAITDADDAHRCQTQRFALGEKATLDRGEQRFGHGVSAAGAADQDRVAILDQLCRLVCCDFFHLASTIHLVTSRMPANRQSSSAYVAASARTSTP